MNLNTPITGNTELDSYLFLLKSTIEDLIFIVDQQNKKGYTGTFTVDGKTITVDRGIITSVV